MGFPEFAWFDFQKESNPVLEVFYATWIKAHLGCGLQTASSPHLGCSRVEMQVKPPERIMSRSDALKVHKPRSVGRTNTDVQTLFAYSHTLIFTGSENKVLYQSTEGFRWRFTLVLRGKKALCFVFRSKYMDYSGSTSACVCLRYPQHSFLPDLTWHRRHDMCRLNRCLHVVPVSMKYSSF